LGEQLLHLVGQQLIRADIGVLRRAQGEIPENPPKNVLFSEIGNIHF